MPLSGRIFRLVESQEQVATLSYVDTLAEQALLEQMLENVKPACPEPAADLHYLLKTPFRYPPLKWGSRFGRVHEPGIFYGGSSVEVTLAESAFYRFIFWYSMAGMAPKASLRSEHTLFGVGYRSGHGIRLHQPPFADFYAALTDPVSYAQTQQLGSAMRTAGVEVFEYCSARDEQHRLCTGVFSPLAFTDTQPQCVSQWLCELSAEYVLFKQAGNSQVYRYALSTYLINNQLPLPA